MKDTKKSDTHFTRLSVDKIPLSLRKYKNILNTLEQKTRQLKSGSKGSENSLAFSSSTLCIISSSFYHILREEVILGRF